MKLFLDCSGTLVHDLYTLRPVANKPLVDAAYLFAEAHDDLEEIVVWTSGTTRDAEKSAALCFGSDWAEASHKYVRISVATKDYELPQDGDYVVDDDGYVWGNHKEYTWLNDYHFFTPDEFAKYGK